MKKYLVTSVVVFLAIGIFTIVRSVRAAEPSNAIKVIVDGAKQMMDGNQKIMAIMAKKGIKDPELASAQQQMKRGYDMIMRGQGLMATKKTEGETLVKRGAKMMLSAQTKTQHVVEQRGMVEECRIDLSECTWGVQKIQKGALDWFFGSPGI